MNNMLKTGLILIILGALASIVFGVLSGTDAESFFGTISYTYTEKTYAQDTYSGLDLTIEDRNIIVLPSTSDEIVLKYYVSDSETITMDETGSTLVMDYDNRWYENVGFNWNLDPEYHRLYVYLPLTIVYSLNLKTSNGKIEFSDYSLASSLSLTTQNGDVVLNDVTVSGDIELMTSNGRIELENVTTAYTIDAATSNGRIIISGVSAKDVSLYTSNGYINALALEADNIEAETSNGHITMGVAGNFADYHVRMTTENGNYYLNDAKVAINQYNTDKENKVYLQTSNGDISVSFD